jgi:hypothetical protein
MPELIDPTVPSSRIYLQARQDEVELVAPISGKHGFGTIYTAPSDYRRKNRFEDLLNTGYRHLELNALVPLLDANTYAGSGRKAGDAEMSQSWIRQQEKFGAGIALTDSGFVEADRLDQLTSLLDQAKELQQLVSIPVKTLIPLDATWLGVRPSELADEIYKRDLRDVALLVGHASDPFGAQRTVKGLLEVLKLGNISLYRSDLSVLPALASGASTGSIGTGTSLRHIYPVASRGGYVPTGSPSVIVGKTLAWRTQDRVNDYVSRFPDETVWSCRCSNCYGRRIDYSIRGFDEVTSHNYNVIADLAEYVSSSSDPMGTWYSMCQTAQTTIYEVADSTGFSWEPPDFLGAWLATQPSTVGVI